VNISIFSKGCNSLAEIRRSRGYYDRNDATSRLKLILKHYFPWVPKLKTKYIRTINTWQYIFEVTVGTMNNIEKGKLWEKTEQYRVVQKHQEFEQFALNSMPDGSMLTAEYDADMPIVYIRCGSLHCYSRSATHGGRSPSKLILNASRAALPPLPKEKQSVEITSADTSRRKRKKKKKRRSADSAPIPGPKAKSPSKLILNASRAALPALPSAAPALPVIQEDQILKLDERTSKLTLNASREVLPALPSGAAPALPKIDELVLELNELPNYSYKLERRKSVKVAKRLEQKEGASASVDLQTLTVAEGEKRHKSHNKRLKEVARQRLPSYEDALQALEKYNAETAKPANVSQLDAVEEEDAVPARG